MLKPSLFSCLSINLCSHDSTWALLCISTTTQGSANLNNLFQLYYYTNPPRPACQDQPPSFKSELPPSFTLPPIFQQLTHKNSAIFTVLVNWSLDKLENATHKIKVGELSFDDNFKTKVNQTSQKVCLTLLASLTPHNPQHTHTDSCMTTQGTMQGYPYHTVHKATQFPKWGVCVSCQFTLFLCDSPDEYTHSVHVFTTSSCIWPQFRKQNRNSHYSGCQIQWQQLRGVCPCKSEVRFSYHYMHNSQSQPEKTNSGPSRLLQPM